MKNVIFEKHKSLTKIIALLLLMCILGGCQEVSHVGYVLESLSSDPTDALFELGIIDNSELSLNDKVTNREALSIVRKVNGDSPFTDLRHWYSDDSLEPLDDLDEDTKQLLISSNTGRIIRREEILTIDLEGYTSWLEALTFVTRMIGNTYACTDHPEEFDFTEASQFLQVAYARGLIADRNTIHLDEYIHRGDFHRLVFEAIHVERSFGGFAPVRARTIDHITSRIEHEVEAQEIIYTSE